MKFTMSGVNTVLLSIVTAILGFLAIQVWVLNGSAHEVATTMIVHTNQITSIQADVKEAVALGHESKGDIALLRQKVDSIRR